MKSSDFKSIIRECIQNEGWQVQPLSKDKEAKATAFASEAERVADSVYGSVYKVDFHSVSRDGAEFWKVMLHSPTGPVKWIYRDKEGKWLFSSGVGAQSTFKEIPMSESEGNWTDKILNWLEKGKEEFEKKHDKKMDPGAGHVPPPPPVTHQQMTVDPRVKKLRRDVDKGNHERNETISRSELKEVIKATLRTILNEMSDQPRWSVSMGKTPGLEERKIPHEEIAAMWEEDKDGEYIQINPDDSVVYVAHGRAMEQIAPRGTGRDMFRLIGSWMKAKNYSPNIWQVNDRGNVELMSQSGRGLGGLTETLDEMTTTSAVAPINLPGNVKGGWVSSRGGSKRGVAGSAALGYELTPIGKQDMQRKQDPV